VPWKLKYLEISQSCDHEWSLAAPQGFLENCHYLQKLSVDNLRLESIDIERICQNGETLQILSLDGCNIDFYLRNELIQKLFKKCSQLTELNLNHGTGVTTIFGNKILLDQHLCALVNNLTPNILKLNLGSQDFLKDKHVKTLVSRCKKITELNLSFTPITNDSLDTIIKRLNYLEKINVHSTNIDFNKLLQLKSIPTLKNLRCFCCPNDEDFEKIKNLRLQLPHISINEEHLHIACPTKEMNGSIDLDWFWEIRAKQQDLFPKAYC
jgi:hypothetical protein